MKKPLHVAVLLALASPAALAQTPPAPATPEKKDEAKAVEGITVVGSRRTNASATDTPVPVDFLPIAKVTETAAQFDLAQTLQYLSPSFYSTRQTGADGADLVDSAALRGLGSDQTLVLVNGKRRHTTSLVNLFGARNRGNTGTDMNTIPMLAIDNVQILRDGASSQYGSDAIAGVINVEYKKRPGCEGIAGYGQYSEGDGKNYLATAYCGFRVGNGGVIALTGEYQDRGRSNRAEEGNPRTIGDSAVENKTIVVNADLPMGPGSLYFTAGTQDREASSGAFARGGVGSDDIPSRNSAAMYPDGFVPFIDGDLTDRHAIVGWRMPVAGFQMDLSQTYGYNKLRYDINNTLNASIAALAPDNRSADRFDAGGFSFAQYTTNLDFTRYFPGVAGEGLNVAFGAEYRKEKYKIFAGEPGSYIDADGVGQGGNAGSQGFPGFQPADETDSSRHSTALYVDLEADVTSRFKLQGALRFEDYSDFGETTTGKIAGLFKVQENFALRGSVSTGFRAPSLQQAFFSSTFTDFISGVPLDVVLAPNGGTIARAAGIPDLKEEKSKSFTFGATWNPTPAMAITADFYKIDIDDRIVLSGRFDADNFPALGSILQSLGVGQAQFFVNSVDTETQGVDLTLSHRAQTDWGRLNTYLGYNYSKTEVKGIHAPPALAGFEDVLLSERERLYLENGSPRQKAVLGFNLASGRLETDLKVIYFGEQILGTFSGTAAGVPNLRYAPKTSADLAFTWTFNPNLRLTVGSANIFDKHPSEQDANETDNGFKYDSVQFGLNGRSYFARLWAKF